MNRICDACGHRFKSGEMQIRVYDDIICEYCYEGYHDDWFVNRPINFIKNYEHNQSDSMIDQIVKVEKENQKYLEEIIKLKNEIATYKKRYGIIFNHSEYAENGRSIEIDFEDEKVESQNS